MSHAAVAAARWRVRLSPAGVGWRPVLRTQQSAPEGEDWCLRLLFHRHLSPAESLPGGGGHRRPWRKAGWQTEGGPWGNELAPRGPVTALPASSPARPSRRSRALSAALGVACVRACVRAPGDRGASAFPLPCLVGRASSAFWPTLSPHTWGACWNGKTGRGLVRPGLYTPPFFKKRDFILPRRFSFLVCCVVFTLFGVCAVASVVAGTGGPIKE